MNTGLRQTARGLAAVSLALAFCGCEGDGGVSADAAGASDAGADPADGYEPPPHAVAVWNQAYQENYAADDVSAILAGAHDGYVLIDPFGSAEARAAIPQLAAAGNTVGCYISSGTCEDWRADFGEMQAYCVGTAWGEWAGEYFVDETAAGLVALMQRRIDAMAGWGCDLVEFDNMDWAFDDENRQQYGFTVTPAEAIDYNRTLCDYARGQGMGCMAKNTTEGATGFDGVTFESYVAGTDPGRDWWPHEELQDFLDAGKLGIVVHYDEPNCDDVYAAYRQAYGVALSFVCEDRGAEAYRHYEP